MVSITKRSVFRAVINFVMWLAIFYAILYSKFDIQTWLDTVATPGYCFNKNLGLYDDPPITFNNTTVTNVTLNFTGLCKCP